MSRLVGVIPAAGRGTRAYPYTRGIPKGMLEIDGEPLIGRVLTIFREQMRIPEVVIVVGEHGELIRERFGDGSALGMQLIYVENDAVDKGLGYSVLQARPHVGDRFVLILSDECYLDSNHEELATLAGEDALAVCAVAEPSDADVVRRNYSVEVENGAVRKIVEKPREPGAGLLGLGTFLFDRRIFDHLEHAQLHPEEGPSDLVSVVGRACAAGERVLPFRVRGRYINVNDRDQLALANNWARVRRFPELRFGLALLGHQPLERLPAALAEFRALGLFDQIAVVLKPGDELATVPEGAAIVRAPSEGFGDRMRAGLDALDADVLFTAWGDGSFAPADVPKFLEYLKEADLVVGTRTTRQLIHQGTNMRGIVRLANILLAKLLDLVWWSYEPTFSDVGCSYRAVWRSTYRLIAPRLRTSGPEYSVEMVLETLRCRRRVIEIPVHFRLWQPGVRQRDQHPSTVFSILSLLLYRRFRAPDERPAVSESRPPS